MTDKRNPIDELFRSKLGNYEMDSPDGLWSNIAQKRATGSIAWYKGNVLIMSSVLILALCGGAYWWNSPVDNQTAAAAPNAAIVAETGNTGNDAAMNTPSSVKPTSAVAYTAGTSTTSTGTNVSEAGSTIAATSKKATSKNPVQKKAAAVSTGTTPPATPVADNSGVTPELPSKQAQAQADLDRYVKEFTNRISETSGKKFTNGTIITKPEGTLFIAKANDPVPADDPKQDEVGGTEAANKSEVAKVKMKKGMWTMDAYGRSVLSYATINGTSAFSEHIAARKASESYPLSFGGGLRANYTWVKQGRNVLTLSGGITYTSVRERLNFEKTVTSTSVSTRIVTRYKLDPLTQQPIPGSEYTESHSETTTTTADYSKKAMNRITLIDIPLTLEVPLFAKQLGGSKFGIALQPGVVANIFMKKAGYEISDNGLRTESLSDIESPYKTSSGLSARIGFSATYFTCPGTVLFVQPSFTQSLTSASSKINYKLNAISLDFGIRFSLAKNPHAKKD